MRNETSIQLILDAIVEGIVASGSELVIDGSFYHELGDYVDNGSLVAKSPEQMMCELVGSVGTSLLDFGCGTGGHRSFLEGCGYNWVGLNYKAGMAPQAAIAASSLADEKLVFYDGENIPFDNGSFDIVYSFQTFEHIQNIDKTFSELYRVLRSGGRLIGAVSYMEQIHDFSTFNFTPYGFKLSLEKAGLKLRFIYPRADVFSFLLRRLLVVTSASDDNSLSHSIHADNRIHEMLGRYGSMKGDIKAANLLRLMFSAHFAFDVIKP